MKGARNAGVVGILTECGGACACSTCQIHVAEDWVGRLPARESLEEAMLEFAWKVDQQHSRLACQVRVTNELDGLVAHVPERQG